MPTYRELLQRTKGEISEIDAQTAQSTPGAVWVDVREADEWQEGHLPGAVHVPRGHLESRIEAVAPDKTQPVILYCAARTALRSPRRRWKTWATRTSIRWPAASPTGSETGSRS